MTRASAALLAVGIVSVAGANVLASRLGPQAGEHRFVCHDTPPTADERAAWRRQLQQQLEESKGSTYYKPLKMHVDFPGIGQPQLQDINEVDLPDSTPIIGVEVGQHVCAFVVCSMVDPMTHIVNMTIDEETPISVTYCDRVDSVRVFSSDQAEPIPLHVGGVDIDDQLVLLLDGKRYGQFSDGIPLSDYPFDRMPLGAWKRKHPSSKVYIAPAVK